MELNVASDTDRGRVRELNEDSVLADLPLVAVADGMGGHEGGEVASSLALEVLGGWKSKLEGRTGPDATASLRDAFGEANRTVWERGRSDDAVAGMGTTLLAGWVQDDVVALAHVGDSRAYLLRGNKLSKLTEDQTVAQEWVRQGRLSEDEAAASPQRHILLQAIGTDPSELAIDVASVELRPGDRLLLATDGLYGMVRAENTIRDILVEHPDAQAACRALIAAANEAGGEDNISVVIVDAVGSDAAPGAAMEDDGSPVVIERPAAAKSRRGVFTRKRVLAAATVLAVAATAAGAAVWLAGRPSYVVSYRGEHVALVDGSPGIDGGAASGEVVHIYRDEPVDRFPPTTKRVLRSGIPVASRQEADRRIASLPRTLGPRDTPTPEPTDVPPSPGSPDPGISPSPRP